MHIEDKVSWEEYPIIHLDCSNETWKQIGLRAFFHQKLNEIAKLYQLELKEENLSNRFQELILAFPKKPVILIDEYDKPIVHFLEVNNERAHENREIMREFYSILKPMGANIHFLFITGITRFAKTSLFSDMNHLNDITINKNFATICGYTQYEVEQHFMEDLMDIAEGNETSFLFLKQELKKWYNGYRWNSKGESVYNPFSVLSFFSNRDTNFDNYWFATGMPTFLIQTINKNKDYDFEEVDADSMMLSNFTIDNLNSVTLLFQAGYLTIKDQMNTFFTLCYPNFEVKQALLATILKDKTHDDFVYPMIMKLKGYFEKREEQKIRQSFDALFGKIPNQIFREKYEFYYHSILVVAMQLLGCYVDAEVSLNNGRVDAVVKTENYIYLIEFKTRESAEQAIQQIKDKSYYQAYLEEKKQLLLMGVLFEDKKVKEMIVEEIS